VGGPSDLVFRELAEAIGPILGVPVVVENKPGASGKIAAEQVARAEPDGQTLLVTGPTQVISLPLLDKAVRYDALKDLRMVSLFVEFDIIFVASAASGITSMKELVARMQNKDAKPKYASIGQPQLTSTGLAYVVLARMTNGDAVEVSYPGQAPGMLDLLAGRTDFATYLLSGTLPHIRSGKLTALAVTTPKRLPQLPDTPTMAEAGFPEYMSANNWVPWIGIAAPARTPDRVVEALNRAIVRAGQTERLKTQIGEAGLRVRARGTAAEDDSEWRAEYARLAGTLQRFNVRLPDEKK
jgi:tripartite-type tricarboxylate transporter receptor subunit TctC